MSPYSITEAHIKAAQYLHGKMDNWRQTDQALKDVGQKFPRNDKIGSVYLKASLLNGSYATFLYYAVYDVAVEIVRIFKDTPEVDGRTLVTRLAQVRIGGKKRLSFASKYAHFFHCDAPPIFDRYAAIALAKHLGKPDDTYYADANYELYCKAVGELLEQSAIRPEPRKLDRYLWLRGMLDTYRKWYSSDRQGSHGINKEAFKLFESQDSDLKAALADLEQR